MDELDLLKELGRDVDPVDPEARAQARRLLEERIRSTGASIDPWRTPRRLKPSILAAVVAALVLLIVAIQLMLPPGSGGPNSAQATLDGLARVAGSTKSRVPIPGSYFYVRSEGFVLSSNSGISSGDQWSYTVPVERETWLASDGSGRILERYGEPRFASEADRTAWRSAGSPHLPLSGSRHDSMYEPGQLAPQDLGALPKDPASLVALISSGGVATGLSSEASDPLGLIADLLGEVPTSPDLRSTLFRATAELPGIQSLGRARDGSGRVGIGIGVVESGFRTELIFDNVTSELLFRSVVRVDAEGSPTQVLSELTYQQRAIVDSTHARPL